MPAASPTPAVIDLVAPDAAAPPAAVSDALRGDLQAELQKAQRLLFFATESGIDVGDGVRDAIVGAAAVPGGPRAPAEVAGLLAAMARLSAAVRPVTAESLVACNDDRRIEKVVKVYRRWAIGLAVLIIPYTLASFVVASITDAMVKDIDVANALAVKLSAQVGPPGAASAPAGSRIDPARLPHDVKEADVITDLQKLAATARATDARARLLNFFVLARVEDPFKDVRDDPNKAHAKFELPAGVPDIAAALTGRINVYQEARYFAQNVRELTSALYGAVAAGLLPLLYALLGACAYLLRMYQQQINNHTFIGEDNHLARFLIAAIGGGVVGLFKNFAVGDAASISPLAIAFLVGYAADVFFSFLDSFVQSFNRGGAAKTPPR